MLFELGYDVIALGPLALGVIIEEGSRRAHVHFPEIKVSLWVAHSELKEVAEEMKLNPAYGVIQKHFEEPLNQMMMPFLMNTVMTKLKATHVLGVDHGTFENVWEEAPEKLKEYYQGNFQVPVFRLSLGLEELRTEEWQDYQKEFQGRLLLTRVLPSGMHKFEITLYLNRN